MIPCVTPETFGAVGDGITDDTVAVQAAINACLAFPRAATLELSARYRVTASLIINRHVDTTLSDFHIRASGPGAGFYLDSSVTLFDTTIPLTSFIPSGYPVSECVKFEGVHFEASDLALAAYVLSAGFLRVSFNHCHFEKIKCVTTPYPLQTMYWLDCNLQAWAGDFVSCAGANDLSWLHCVIEHGEALFHNVSTVAASYSLRLMDNVIENLAGKIVHSHALCGFIFGGNYVEHDTPNTIDATGGPGVSAGVTLSGNTIFNSGGITAHFGSVVGLHVTGNCVGPSPFYDATIGATDVLDHGNATHLRGATSGMLSGLGRVGYAPSAVTITRAGVSCPLIGSYMEVTTDGDGDEDSLILGDGFVGQVLHVVCVTIGSGSDSWKIAPVNPRGWTKISFAAFGVGKGCSLVYSSAGWIVLGAQGGVVS